jgi:hypothetical protein
MAGFCECDNEPSGSLETEVLERLSVNFSRNTVHHKVDTTSFIKSLFDLVDDV